MIKIKVLQCRPTVLKYDGGSHSVSDYLYCIYVFGVLMHTVTVYGIDKETAERLFKKHGIVPF